ncbi:pyridoxamine 5'-phosphate oxidase family protein (plasmid) [Aquamicrobium terrae]
MGLGWRTIPDDMRAFIEAQKLFFVATAPSDGRVNLSPKGLDTLRILDERTVAYLDLTGSGNETAAHVTENGRMTMMFCAFSGQAMTLRLYGKAELIRPDHPEWETLRPLFPDLPGVRQIFRLKVDSAATSCGWSIPVVGEMQERDELVKWADAQSEDEIEAYRLANNVVSIDGLSTGYVSDDF